jgi:rubredoxin
MPYWICSQCDYICEVDIPDETCPSCHNKCVFSDVTCYLPECGCTDSGKESVDTRLVNEKIEEHKNRSING